MEKEREIQADIKKKKWHFPVKDLEPILQDKQSVLLKCHSVGPTDSSAIVEVPLHLWAPMKPRRSLPRRLIKAP